MRKRRGTCKIRWGCEKPKVFSQPLVDGGVNYPQFAMVTLLRLAACSVPLLIGLTSRCFAHRARASCAPRHYHPYQFPLKSYGFPGAETARKRFLLWKMGFSAAAYCEPRHPSIQHGRTTALASSLAALPCSLDSSAAIAATGCAASFVPLTQGSLLVSGPIAGSSTVQKPPFSRREKGGGAA